MDPRTKNAVQFEQLMSNERQLILSKRLALQKNLEIEQKVLEVDSQNQLQKNFRKQKAIWTMIMSEM